jgi:hypothetical protein
MAERYKRWLGFELKPTVTPTRVDWVSPLGPPAPKAFVMIRHNLAAGGFEAHLVFSRSTCAGGLDIDSGTCPSEQVARRRVELKLKTLHQVTNSIAPHLSKKVQRRLV